MNELVAKIKELSNAFFMDAELQTEKGNKAAGTRARKASLELEKLLKEIRGNVLFVFALVLIGTVIYYPFFKVYEKNMLAQENGSNSQSIA